MCVSITVFSAECCLSKTADLRRMHAVLPHCDSVLADKVQRGLPLCQPSPLPHKAHLRFLLHTSSKAQILLRLDTRWALSVRWEYDGNTSYIDVAMKVMWFHFFPLSCQLMQSATLQVMVSWGWMKMESHVGTSSLISTSWGSRYPKCFTCFKTQNIVSLHFNILPILVYLKPNTVYDHKLYNAVIWTALAVVSYR